MPIIRSRPVASEPMPHLGPAESGQARQDVGSSLVADGNPCEPELQHVPHEPSGSSEDLFFAAFLGVALGAEELVERQVRERRTKPPRVQLLGDGKGIRLVVIVGAPAEHNPVAGVEQPTHGVFVGVEGEVGVARMPDKFGPPQGTPGNPPVQGKLHRLAVREHDGVVAIKTGQHRIVLTAAVEHEIGKSRISTRLPCPINHPLEPVRREEVVLRRIDEVFTTSLGQGDVHHLRSSSEVGGGGEQTEPFISRRETRQQSHAVVGGAVVDEQDLESRECLVHQGTDEALKVRLAVVHRHDDRHDRNHGRHVRIKCLNRGRMLAATDHGSPTLAIVS